MKVIISSVLALLILSWLFPWFEAKDAWHAYQGGFGFIFGNSGRFHQVDIVRVLFLDMMILSAGGIAYAFKR